MIECKDCKWYPSGPMGLEIKGTCWCKIKNGSEFVIMEKCNRFGTCCFYKSTETFFDKIIKMFRKVK